MEQTPMQNPVPSPMPNMAPVVQGAKGSGMLIKVIGIVVLLGIIAGGALLGARVWDPLWSPFRPSPEKVMAMMMENMKNVKTSHTIANMGVEVKAPMNAKLSLMLDGNSDISDITNPVGEFTFRVSLTGATPAESMSATVMAKMIGKELYFNISEANLPPLALMLAMTGIDLDAIKGVWVKAPAQEELAQASSPDVNALTKKLQDMVAASSVYNLKEQLADETISGQKMYHYLLTLDNEKLAKLMGDMVAEAMKSPTVQQDISGGNDPSTSMLTELFGSGAIQGIVSQALEKIGQIDVEFFIGQTDYLLYGVKMEKSLNLSSVDPGMTGSADISFETSYSNYNVPVAVLVPSTFKTFDEVFPQQPLMPGKL